MGVMVPISIESLTSEQTLHAILAVLLRMEGAGDITAELAGVERDICANTAALSTLSTNPPGGPS